MQARAFRTGVLAVCLLCLIAAAHAQPSAPPAGRKKVAPTAPSAPGTTEPPVAVYVNGEPIYVAEMEQNYESVAKIKQLDSARAHRSKAELLDQLINRRLTTQALEKIGKLVTTKELDDGRRKFETELRQKKITIEQWVRARGITAETLRKDMYWSLAWDRYLERNLADALEQYFNQHKKDLDGTQVRASHILFRAEKYSDSVAQLTAVAMKVREAIEAGKMTFEEAALKYSAGPSRERGGDLGFFPRRGVMADEFAQAAFALEKGQISQPVNTAFGMHLVRVTDLKPGKLQWTQVIPQIKVLASVELLEEISQRERKKAKLEFTGLTPYFSVDAHELVVPPDEVGQAAAK